MQGPTVQHPFKSRSFVHSLRFAMNGLTAVFQTERNFRAHTVMTGLVIVAGLYFGVHPLEWALLILCIVFMMTVEILNTALEYLVDMIVGGAPSEKAKLVKDIAAGACLLAAIGVGLVGGFIFLPHLLEKLSG
jgi:diacylglycerol kinase (ATP)